jgi:hypothetical protein
MARLDLAAGDALGNFFRIDLELIRRDLFFDLFYFVGAFARARQLSDPFLIMCQTGGAFLGHHQSTRLTWMLFGNFAVFLNCRVGFAPRMMNKIQIRVDPGGGMLQGRTTPCVRNFRVFVPKRFERSEAVERLERFERLERTDPYDERPHPARSGTRAQRWNCWNRWNRISPITSRTERSD